MPTHAYRKDDWNHMMALRSAHMGLLHIHLLSFPLTPACLPTTAGGVSISSAADSHHRVGV